MHFNLWANMQKRLIQLQGEKIPVLCLWGDKDTILPIETNQFQELIPHAKVQIYQGFTHMFPIEFAEKAAVSIQQFWDECLRHLFFDINKRTGGFFYFFFISALIKN